MALEVEGVVDGGLHAEKPLGGASRLEPLHFALSSSHRLMRVFGPIVLRSPCSCGQFSRKRRNAEAYERSLSVTSNLGLKPCFLSSLRISRSAARVSRRR
jgi:hypothetical protein